MSAQHASQSKRGIILTNIGTPESTATEDVARYLSEFLMDPDVINLPWLLRFPLVRGLIVPTRAPKSAEKYAKIWMKEGSPLLVHTLNLAQKLENKLGAPVRVGMRYGKPSLSDAVQDLRQMGVREFDLVPMFPQYAEATTLSVVKELSRTLGDKNSQESVRVLKEFFTHPAYQQAMTASIRNHPWQNYDRVLFSFHGLPESAVRKDSSCQLGECCQLPGSVERRCYRAQCVQTAKTLAQSWQIPSERWSFSFQSRLGPAKWIQPYTEQTLRDLAASGVKSILVLCPAFTTDCLETLEEIQIEMKNIFLSLGGQKFDVVPCLNSTEEWTAALAVICQQEKAWNSLPSELGMTK